MKNDDESFSFSIITPEELMAFSTIPPFKVYFNINLLDTTKTKHRTTNGAIAFNEEHFMKMLQLYRHMKEKNK